VNEDVIRSLVISHHLLDTREIVLIHHTRCGMLAFTDDLLRGGLEGDQASVELLRQATGRHFVAPACPRRARTRSTRSVARSTRSPRPAEQRSRPRASPPPARRRKVRAP
jgi:carbonic anhydrase